MRLLHSIPDRLIVRHLWIWLVGLLPGLLMAQAVSIGRSSLTLPDPSRWSVQNLSDLNVGYVGDKSGNFVMEVKRLVFHSTSVNRKAIAILKVTKGGIGGVHMSWSNNCVNLPSSQFVYKRDLANGNDVDCLIVASVGNTSAFIDSWAAFKQSLDGNVPEGGSTYYIEFTKSIGAGGIAHSQILLSQDFKGLEGGSVEHSTLISAPVLAWAEQFAKNNRRAITSFSGSWAMPALAFSNN